MPIIITSIPMFAMCNVKVEPILSFVKIVNQCFEKKEHFLGGTSSEVLMTVL